ncbi:MAG: tetratricopeptide repeat protein [Caldilinea sp. CFX5]|nr:tetratricopeptide repeat protein [Caldilinea sp. CFX5]
MRRGEIRWCNLPSPDKRRPVLILTRTSAIPVLTGITIAPLTTTLRNVGNSNDFKCDMTNNNFDNLWDYNQPAATEARFRELLPQLADDPARQAELLTQIARAQGLQRRFDEAHATLDGVETALATSPVRVRIRYLLERGRVYNSSGKVDAARPFFLEAWEVAQPAGEDDYAIDAAHMMGIIEPPAEQRRWNFLALELTERTTDPAAKRWAGALNNNLGWSYFEEGDYTAALACFTKALTAREAQGKAGPIHIARWCVAKTLRMLGRVDEALTIQEALAAAEQLGEPDGYVYEELGECYLIRQEAAKATVAFAQAYQLLSQDHWLATNESERLARLQTLGQIAT